MKRHEKAFNAPDRGRMGLYRFSMFILTLAALVAGFDVAAWVVQIPAPSWHMPFTFAAALGFIGFVCAAVSHGSVYRSGSYKLGDGYDRDSYLHPDNHPKGRRDAPDGTSD